MEAFSQLDSTAIMQKMGKHSGVDKISRPVSHCEVITVVVTKTRPADTTPYVAGDAISGSTVGGFQFSVGDLGIPQGLIVAARLVRDAVTDTSVRFRTFVHDAPPASGDLPADNTLYPVLFQDRLSRRGWIDFATGAVGDATGSDCLDYVGVLSGVQSIPYSTGADGILRLCLTTRDALTPAASKNYSIELDILA